MRSGVHGCQALYPPADAYHEAYHHSFDIRYLEQNLSFITDGFGCRILRRHGLGECRHSLNCPHAPLLSPLLTAQLCSNQNFHRRGPALHRITSMILFVYRYRYCTHYPVITGIKYRKNTKKKLPVTGTGTTQITVVKPNIPGPGAIQTQWQHAVPYHEELNVNSTYIMPFSTTVPVPVEKHQIRYNLVLYVLLSPATGRAHITVSRAKSVVPVRALKQH